MLCPWLKCCGSVRILSGSRFDLQGKTGSDFSEKADTDPTFEKINPRIRPFKNNPDPDPQPYWFCFINGLSM